MRPLDRVACRGCGRYDDGRCRARLRRRDRDLKRAGNQMTLTTDQVAEFLRQNPGFFENHVDILMNLQVPHPHGGRAVSISERQLIAVREKSKILEDKLRELIQFGEENDALSEKVHRFACRLIEAPSLDASLDTLYLDLLDHFAVPHVAVRLWNVAEVNPETKEFAPVAEEMRQFVEQMALPYFGHD